MIVIRPARWPQDIPALSALDTSFITNTVYRVARKELSFRLVEETATPLHKTYPFDPADPEEQRNWDHAVVAEVEGRLVGFAAAQYVTWNRRMVIWHLYVAPESRGLRVGSRLLNSIEGFARDAGARCLWLETQNVNVPAVRFYLRSGFALCGLDSTLYDPDSAASGEVALYFARAVKFPETRVSP